MVSVKIDSVSKSFGNVQALRNVSLEIMNGEFFAILGPSGCGKTTLLRIIAGLEKPTKGRIFFDEIDVTDVPAEIRDVSMVFQFYALYPTTVYNNIALPLRSKGLSPSQVHERVVEIAKLVGIESILNTHVDRISVADKQKVALARAIAKQPQLYLLDEPLTILDPVSRVIMRAELKRIQKELKQTIIYVTHDQIEALTLADRIAVMNFGVVEQVGTPLQVYDYPETVFVGWFLGEPGMNFIEANVEPEVLKISGKPVVRERKIFEDLRRKGYEKILIGFRPEHVKISKTPSTYLNGKAVIEGVVRVVEFMGTYYVVDVESDGAEFKVKMDPRSFTSLSINEGEKVWCTIPLDKILFFDSNNNKRINIGGSDG
uniref:ABC transporter ATP-binding protein n=1 Tax=Thermosphaera aggregans TaxID=54254 RepID=A0A7C2G1R7_9CREN